jgi:hypothetical protein
LDSAESIALAIVRNGWPKLNRSYLQFVHLYRVMTREQRARVALAALRIAPARGDCARAARRLARSLKREGAVWSAGFAELIDASLHFVAGRQEEAAKGLHAAEQHFVSVGMHLYAVAARRSRGSVIAGDSGRGLIETADQWMRARGIANPAKMTHMLIPGIC